MKKSFYVVSIFSLLAIILLSIFFSGYIAFSLIIWVLCFGYGIYKFRNSSSDMDLKLNSNEQKIVDGALELITKLYFSKDYKEFIGTCSYQKLNCIKEWFANTKNSDCDIFKAVESKDFEEMLYLSSNLYYDVNGLPTEKYKKAIETYDKIKATAKNLLQNNNLILNPDNEDLKSDCLKLLCQSFHFTAYFVKNVFLRYSEQESGTVVDFYKVECALQMLWIEKCQKIKKNGFEVPTKSETYKCENDYFSPNNAECNSSIYPRK